MESILMLYLDVFTFLLKQTQFEETKYQTVITAMPVTILAEVVLATCEMPKI